MVKLWWYANVPNKYNDAYDNICKPQTPGIAFYFFHEQYMMELVGEHGLGSGLRSLARFRKWSQAIE